MCTYKITLSDTLVEKARPAIGNETDITQWMQQQLETLLLRLAFTTQQKAKVYTEPYAPDLEAILSMPVISDAEMDMNGEQARMDYLTERYAL